MQLKRNFGLANVTSLVERVSRVTMILKNQNRTPARVMGHLAKVTRPFLARHVSLWLVIEGPRSWTGRIFKPKWEFRHDSIIQALRRRKALSRTPIDVPEDRYHATLRS